MKKIFILMGSRQRTGNTRKFVKSICDRLDEKEFEIEWGFPQDFKINPCIGCQDCFINTQCSMDDDINLLQEKILKSDLFIVASPVYVHYMTADLKLIFDRIAWWAHTLRLQGKPVVILSTCSSNGFNSVIEPLGKIITYMGGNVIATSNAAEIPDQINNMTWIDEVSSEIAKRIMEYVKLPPQSNPFIEKVFSGTKIAMMYQVELSKESEKEYKEGKYWKETGMLEYQTFENYLEAKLR